MLPKVVGPVSPGCHQFKVQVDDLASEGEEDESKTAFIQSLTILQSCA
jgi:hypothetical protein